MSLDAILQLPLVPAVALLTLVALLRGSATYALGRGVAASTRRAAPGRGLDSARARRAQEWITRWGALAVTLSFLTVGLQTAINLTAGALRMPWWRYGPALLLGALAWGVLYATVGLGVIAAVPALIAHPIGASVVILVSAVAGVRWYRRRRARAAAAVVARESGTEPEDAPAVPTARRVP